MTEINGFKRYGPDTDDPDICAHCKNRGWWQGSTQPYFCECPIGQEMKAKGGIFFRTGGRN